MPVSDIYVIQYLLQETRRASAGIQWQERSMERASYTAHAGNVQVDIETAHFRAGSRLLVRFKCGIDEAHVLEPAALGWLGRRFANEDDRHLARLMHELQRAAAAQCRKRREFAFEHAGAIRERIYRSLLFEGDEHSKQGQPAEVEPG